MPDAVLDGDRVAGILREWGEIPVLRAVAAIVLGYVAIRAIRRGIPRLAVTMPDRHRLAILPWGHLLQMAVVLGVAVVVTPMVIRPTAENLLAVVAALALAIGFAFKDYVSSLIAGVVVLFERPYCAGDWVRIGDIYGEVRALNLRTVELMTPNDSLVFVPHSAIWAGPIHNANAGRLDLMVVADFYLRPDHDGEAVRRALHDVALTSPFLRLGSPVSVVAAEEPWGTHYRLKAHPIDGRDQFPFLTDLTLRGKAVFRRLGVRHATAPASPAGGPLS